MNPVLALSPVLPLSLLLLAAALLPGVASADKQMLWGYGVRGCDAFVTAAAAADDGDFTEYQRYEDWLTGFMSGLNLALGEDVLRGAGIDKAMQRTRRECETRPGEDFFNAAMGFVRTLSSMR